MMVFVIIFDGLSGLGKGILVGLLVYCLGWNLLDFGVIYCLLVYGVGKVGIDLIDEVVLVELVVCLDVQFVFGQLGQEQVILLDGEDVICVICIEQVGVGVLKVVVLLVVCVVLLDCQCVFCVVLGLIVDGCDMGMVVFFDVLLKIFLMVSVEECVCCCYFQLKEKGEVVNFVGFFEEICVCD